VRGEHRATSRFLARDRGSSPRARGAPPPPPPPWRAGGIIPACAGSTPTSGLPASVAWDHPRVRGEHVYGLQVLQDHRGSSPRARGARRAGELRRMTRGIIPACAGSTISSSTASTPYGDHPRVRGEHVRGHRRQGRWRGSSPRARGALPEGHRGGFRVGIIPACAGST